MIEVEYITTSEAAKEAIWLQWLAANLKESGPESEMTLILFCDS